MTCPYLKEVAMVFCRACPVKKPVPANRVTTASQCEAGFESCPIFREALARAEGRLPADEENPPPDKKGATP